jgi:hypothetical protein
MSIIPTPSLPNLLTFFAATGTGVIAYNFAGVIVNEMILANTDHVLICVVLTILSVLLLSLLLVGAYYVWLATANDWVKLWHLILYFFVSLGGYVVILLLQSLIGSPFFTPGSGNQVIYFMLLFFATTAFLFAISRRSFGHVASGH